MITDIQSTNLGVGSSYVYQIVSHINPAEPQILAVEVSEVCPLEKQCVSYVQSKGLQVEGYARDIVPNSDVPMVGGGVLLHTKLGHIAYIEKKYPDSILISDTNYEACGIISYRIIKLNDPQIRGFVK